MGRKRNPKTIKEWDRVHDQLAEIMQSFRFYKTNRSHVKTIYWGTGKQLRKNCIAILNLLESMNPELKYGLSAEDRWT
jgi:hypothetical protein